MFSDLKRAAAAMALTVLVVAAPPAAAQAPAAPSPGEKIADALRRSPVYVDAAYADSVPTARQQQLVRQIEKTGLPIKVALVPIVQGDAYDGESDVFAEVVHDRLDERELILVTAGDRWTGDLNGFEWPGEEQQAADAVRTVGFLDEMKDAGLAEQTAKAVELIERGDGEKAYEEATDEALGPDSGGGSSARPDDGAAGSDKSDSGAGDSTWQPLITAALALALALALAAGVLFFFVRRRRRGPGTTGSPFAFPQAVFAAAREADEAALRRQTEAEVVALGDAAQAADTSTPALQQALDAYAAAGTVLDAARGLPDLAGVLALVAEGRDALVADGRDDALEGTSTPLPLCFFNPLHGRAERRIRWRPLGRRDHLHIAACEACGTAVRTRRAPEVLTDTDADGRSVPYFEIPADRSVWAATGYGSLLRDGEDGLAGRVGRGEFSRGRG
ncbi:hypothetical protein AB0O76_10800 [Streptomyces sp. NPDC086554]|uniref:hypothetical protein n=1 Tax=Streptomyces sp. NPDC086554 TaxID=3154864 RepID=UPI00343853E3